MCTYFGYVLTIFEFQGSNLAHRIHSQPSYRLRHATNKNFDITIEFPDLDNLCVPILVMFGLFLNFGVRTWIIGSEVQPSYRLRHATNENSDITIEFPDLDNPCEYHNFLIFACFCGQNMH